MKSNLSAKETLLYNEREKSEVIFVNNLTGETAAEIEKQMVFRQNLFIGRAKNLVAHIIISPDPEDGKVQTRLDWKEIGNSFLRKAGLSNHQSVGYLHKDKDHFHLHIVTNRIDADGRIYRGGHELAMSQRIGDEIANERGLRRAAEISKKRRLLKQQGIDLEGEVGAVAEIRKIAKKAAVIARSPGKFDQARYFQEIEAAGFVIKIHLKKDKNGRLTNEIHGYSMGKKDEQLLNASQIGKEFTLRKLNEEALGQNPKVDANYKKIGTDIQRCFELVINNKREFKPQYFFEELRSSGYVVREHLDKSTGKPRGYGFQIGDTIVNASEIGAEFTLKCLKRKQEEIFGHRVKTNPLSDVSSPKASRLVSEYQYESKPTNDFARAVDLEVIKNDLRNITSGHRYKSYDDFIKAIEKKGYHVHLRYSKGQLSGYTIHHGTRHYHDKEIGEEEFSLDRLFKRGLIQKNTVKVTQAVDSSPSEIIREAAAQKETSTEKKSVSLPSQNLANVVNLSIAEREVKRNELKREETRRVIARELANHIKHLISNGQSISFDKYFSQLQMNGYRVFKHLSKETGLIRGYNIEKYGFKFHASEIGREFTLMSISEMTLSKKKIVEVGQHRIKRPGISR